MPNKISVVILDDHHVVRIGLEANILQNNDFSLLGSYGTSEQLLTALTENYPHVILMDFSLGIGEMDGLNLIQFINARYPQCKILIVSAIELAGSIALMLRAGAKGVVSKTQPLEQLNHAIRTVALGRTYLTEKVKNELNRELKYIGSDNEVIDPYIALSSKELEVIRCCLSGMKMTDIANKFSKSIKTVSAQKLSAFKKMGVTSDRELFMLNSKLK
ncbi:MULTISPECIES: response regulator transcription factor [unclassified Iodobacter]|uniref:response regulator transcription factor n=1 Tax=unclassified Iodobacter TaxID=235634 RepID=UPI0025F9C68E|nr:MULTISPECIES: response regulator transcription factor [unclassified Iodobacter]MDW5415924.1 response regulator transcription factor [Iodobacter sp. CM08]